LGKRHWSYGVKDAQDAAVGVAWLWTLGQGSGERCKPAVWAAWAIGTVSRLYLRLYPKGLPSPAPTVVYYRHSGAIRHTAGWEPA